MTISLRTLRLCTDTLCLLLGAVTFATGLAALMIAAYWERIMSAYADQLICGLVFGAVALLYFIASIAVTAKKPRSRFTSLLGSTVRRELLMGLGAGLAGYQSDVFWGSRVCMRYRSSNPSYTPTINCRMPVVAGVLAWVTVGAIALGVGLDIAVVTTRYGNTKRVWRSSLAQLEQDAETYRSYTAPFSPPKE